MDRRRLLPNVGLARSSCLCHAASGDFDACSGFSSPLGSPQADRALDDPDLAVRLRYRRACIFNALPLVSTGSVEPEIPTHANLAHGNDLMFHHNEARWLRIQEIFMVTIATFNEGAKARQLKRRFQDAGIKADVHNEAPLQQVGFMSRPQANAKVMVEDSDFEKAQELMIEWEATDPDISAALIRCPQCGSSNIEYPQMTRKFMTPALVGVLCALKIIPKEFYCQDCHFTWSNQEEPTIGRLWHRFFPGRESSPEAS